MNPTRRATLTFLFPPIGWLGNYRLSWMGGDLTGGITLAACAHGYVRDLMPRDGLAELVGSVARATTLEAAPAAVGPR